MKNIFEEFLDPNILKIINSFRLNIMKSDFWRYFVTYLKGGIYSDTDARLLKPF